MPNFLNSVKHEELRRRIIEATLQVRASQIALLLDLHRFDPNQPRVPAGYRYGGRWTDEDNFGPPAGVDHVRESLRPLLVSNDPEDFENITESPPLRPSERATLAQRLATLYLNTRPELRIAALFARYSWLLERDSYDILAYFDPPKSLGELYEGVARPKPGYDVHHIIEQGPARRDGMDEWRIEARENLVLIPRFKHWEINRWYSTRNKNYGDLTPRDYLRGKNWQARKEVGLEALRLFGVLKR